MKKSVSKGCSGGGYAGKEDRRGIAPDTREKQGWKKNKSVEKKNQSVRQKKRCGSMNHKTSLKREKWKSSRKKRSLREK